MILGADRGDTLTIENCWTPPPMKSEGRSDMHLYSLANIEVTRRCHPIIPTSQRACRGNCKLDACQGGLLHGCQGKFTSWPSFKHMICLQARGLQTMICLQVDQQGLQGLQNISYVSKHVVGKVCSISSNIAIEKYALLYLVIYISISW